jgi:hypothetical protein
MNTSPLTKNDNTAVHSDNTHFSYNYICTIPDQKTEIVVVVIVHNIIWAKGWEGVRGDWKVRGGQLIPGKGPEWMGIRHHEQDSGLPSNFQS